MRRVAANVTAECWGLGEPRWLPAALERSILLEESAAFFRAYKEQRAAFKKANAGGNGLLHSLALWTILRRLRPPVVVESGVLNGQTSWLIRRATAAWHPYLVRLDPSRSDVWRDDERSPLANRTIDFLGEHFIDVASPRWVEALPLELRARVPVSRWLFFLDDHHDHLRRLAAARSLGARHILLDDNYIAGFGDSFSAKAACDGGLESPDLRDFSGGATRRFFAKRAGRPTKRCERFHRKCHAISEAEASQARVELLDLADIYWEAIPLVPLAPRRSSRPPFAQYSRLASWAEGAPGPYSEAQLQVLVSNCKPPLMSSVSEASALSGIAPREIEHEAGNFVNMAYIRLRK